MLMWEVGVVGRPGIERDLRSQDTMPRNTPASHVHGTGFETLLDGKYIPSAKWSNQISIFSNDCPVGDQVSLWKKSPKKLVAQCIEISK
jgi:hypothetical protein